MFAFDSLSGPLPSWSLWLLAALGVGLYEEAMAARDERLRPRPVKLSPRRMMLPLFGLGVGAVVAVAAPTHVAAQLSIFTLSPSYLTQTGSAHADFVGRVLVQATCDSARSALVGSHVEFDCFDPLQSGPGTGLVRIQARNRAEFLRAQRTFFSVTKAVHRGTRIAIVTPPVHGKPTWARTAPVAATLLFAELALLLPSVRFKRRTTTAPRSAPASLSPAYR
jgi:hypothetical protein